MIERGHLDVVHTGDVSAHFNVAGQFENFLGDGTCCDPANGFAGGGATATFVITYAKLSLVSEVSVRRTELILHFLVGGGTVVAIRHVDTDRGTRGLAVIETRDYLCGVAFLTGCGDIALSRAAAI